MARAIVLVNRPDIRLQSYLIAKGDFCLQNGRGPYSGIEFRCLKATIRHWVKPTLCGYPRFSKRPVTQIRIQRTGVLQSSQLDCRVSIKMLIRFVWGIHSQVFNGVNLTVAETIQRLSQIKFLCTTSICGWIRSSQRNAAKVDSVFCWHPFSDFFHLHLIFPELSDTKTVWFAGLLRNIPHFIPENLSGWNKLIATRLWLILT